MKELEEKIKDRVEGYESNLPDGDFAEFKALLDHSAATSNKRKMAYLAWLAPATVAAGLALFFILRPSTGTDPIQSIYNGSIVAQVIEPVTIDDNIDVVEVESKPSASSKVKGYHYQATKLEEAPVPADNTSRTDEPSEKADTPDAKDTDGKGVSGTSKNNGSISRFFTTTISDNKKTVSMKVGPAAAGVLGGSGLIALASMPTLMFTTDKEPSSSQSTPVVDPGGTISVPEPDEKTGNNTHHMPLRAGLSLRVPFNDRWSLTTGVDYAWYSSTIGYSVSGGHKQDAHYVGIPIRADYTIARNRWLDVYVGAGASADFCIAAFEDGSRIAKDGIGFSLIGSGGVQFNITNNLGLFFDPTFSWNIPADNRILDTYKSDHPFIFSVSSGIRVTLQNKR